MFERYDVFVTPSAGTPAFDVNRYASGNDRWGQTGELHGGSTLNAAMTMASCAAVAVPAGFDQYGRPVGLQIAAPPRQEARALSAAAFLERLTGLDKPVPLDPRPGVLPPG